MRRAAALAFIPLLAAVAVAGCGSSSSSKPAAASDTYKSVTVTGEFDVAPKVTIPKEKGAGALLTKTLIKGNGAKLSSTDGLIGQYVVYDWSGKTSKLLGSSYAQGTPSLFLQGQVIQGVQAAITGQTIGSRVLAVVPPADGIGPTAAAQEGIGASDTLVFVIDLDKTFATGSVAGTQTSTGGGALPTVTAPAANSKAGPTIKIPAKTTPPKTLQVKTLLKGTGATVKKGQDIAVQYTGMNWRTGKVFDSSWSRQQPLSTQIGEGAVIPGWDTGLVGQTVGSRVLLVIPPKDGYGSSGASQAGINGTDTLVFVVDILAAA